MQGRIQRGGAKGAVPHPRPVKNSELALSIPKLKSEEHKKIVWCSFSALRRLYAWTIRATMTEVRMKNVFRMNIHPNQMALTYL